MSVRVYYPLQLPDGVVEGARLYADAEKFEAYGEAATLALYDSGKRCVALYASGRWISAEVVAEPVNGAAEPKAYAHEPECNTIHDGPAACPPPAEPECPCRDHVAARADVETTTTAEAVLSETSEPYVSVSVSGNDAEQVLKLVREGLREHRSDYVLRG